MEPQEGQLNVLLLIIDDLRPDLGAYGKKWARTPNMDTLAQRGTLFTNAHAAVSNCAPSRAALLTGRRPDFNGVIDLYTHVRDHDPHVVTLPQHFRQSGYLTASHGKIFHHGHDDEPSWSPQSEVPDGNSCRGKRSGCDPGWTYFQYFDNNTRHSMKQWKPRLPLSERGRPCTRWRAAHGPAKAHACLLAAAASRAQPVWLWHSTGRLGRGYTDYILASRAIATMQLLVAQARRTATSLSRTHSPPSPPQPEP